MSLSRALGTGCSASLDSQSSIASSSKPNHEYSPGLSQKAIDILENGLPSPGIATPPYRFRFNVLSPASRQFAPVPSPLEHFVPYTPKTRLVPPTVSDHLNSALASSPKVYSKHRRAGARSFFSKMVERLIDAIHPPLRKRDARLIPSTPEDIVDYLSDQNSEPWGPEVHYGRFGGMSQEEKKKAMLVFDVFTTENRALRAFAIGPSPQSPLYIFYPLKHPYDEALIETLANRGDRICIYPPYTPDTDPYDDMDEDKAREEKRNEKDEKASLWEKALKTLCMVTKRKATQKPTSIPLQTLRPVSEGPEKPQVTYSLSQSFLQFRDPLEGFRPETVSGIRWSSLWINQRFRNCLDDPPAPKPTQEELTAQARRTIRIACYEARLARLSGVQKWFYELMHKRGAYRAAKIRGKAAGSEQGRGSPYTQHEAHEGRQDAGAMFIEPDVTISQDVRIAEYILPALNAEKKKNVRGHDSYCSTDTGYSSGRDLSPVATTTSEGSSTTGQQEKPKMKIMLQRKHPIFHRDPVFSESHTRRPQTIHDLSTLIGHLKLTLPTVEPDESAFNTEYVIADEYLAFHQHKYPTELVADEPGIQVFYEPPAFRTKAEKRQSDVEYISGRYFWVHKRTVWAVVYERRRPSKIERRENMQLKEEERKEWEEAQLTWGNGDWRSKGERLQKKLARGPPRNYGRVKLYNPAGTGQELLGYLNLEKGQLSIRRDVTTGQLHLAVLAMFSVVNLEEAVEREQRLVKAFEAAKDVPSAKALLASSQKHPDVIPGTGNDGIQTAPKANYPECTLKELDLQLPRLDDLAEDFALVGNNDTKTFFGSTGARHGVKELVRRVSVPSTAEFADSSSDSESDSGSDGVQEIMWRTSRGWRRRSGLPQDAEERKSQLPRYPPAAKLPNGH